MLDQPLLLFMLMFALLLRYVLPLFGDWQQSDDQEGLPSGEPTKRSLPPVLLSMPRSSDPQDRSARVDKRATAQPMVASAVIPPGHRRRQMLRRHEARRGILLMTILGPCRALEASQPPQ